MPGRSCRTGDTEMTSTRLFVVLIVVSVCYTVYAFVDLYKFHFDVTRETKERIVNYAYSYYDERDSVLASYTGEQAEKCKGQLANQPSYALPRAILQAKMIGIVSKIEKLDTEWFNATQKCGKNEVSCVESANQTWSKKLSDFNCSTITSLCGMKQEKLDEIKKFMDDCIKKNA